MINIKTFRNEEFGQIRIKEKDNKIWFVAIDICRILEIGNSSDAIRRIKNEWVDKVEIPHPQSKTKGLQVNAVNEPGLYKLIMRSNKPEAEKFTDWIAEEVLPSIRKHGLYTTNNTLDKIVNNPEFGIKLLTQLKREKDEKKRLRIENSKQNQIIGELKPKADYTDTILKNNGLVTITQIAKDYGISGRAMNKLLYKLGVQYKQSGQWLLYAKHHDKGYTHSETIDIVRSSGNADIVMNTKWTQKGRLFLYNILKSKGVLPLIENKSEFKIAK